MDATGWPGAEKGKTASAGLGLVFTRAPVACLLLDERHLMRAGNPRAAHMLGLADDAPLVGQPLANLARPDQRQAVTDHLNLAAQGESAVVEVELDAPFQPDPTRPVTVRMESVPLHRDLLLTALFDVTQTARAWAQAERSEVWARLLLDWAAEGIYAVDEAGRCIMCNRAGARMLGYADARELVGRDMHALIHHSHSDGAPYPADDCPVRQAIATRLERAGNGETFWRADGTSFPVAYRARPMWLDDSLVGAVVTFSDISERQHAEEALLRALDELSRANRELERFTTAASHDLREPLRSVTAYAQMLQRRHGETLGPDGRDMVDLILDGAARLNAIVDGLGAFRDHRQGGARASVNVAEVIDTAIAELADDLRACDGSIEREAMPAVAADPVQLGLLFRHLLANALRFRRPGHPPRVGIGCRRGDGAWTFQVADNGLGIPPEYHERIFYPFQRCHPPGIPGGVGLGLALCRRVVANHGGQMWVEPNHPHGSVFCFTLPMDGGG